MWACHVLCMRTERGNMKRRLFAIVAITVFILIGVVIFFSESDGMMLDSSLYDVAYSNGKKVTIMGETKYGLKGGTDQVTINHSNAICDLACATTFMVLCDSKGEVYIVGKVKREKENKKYELLHLIKGLKEIENVSAGDNFFLARDSKGNVWGYGDNSYGQIVPDSSQNYFYEPVLIDIEAKAKKLECGFNTSCIVTNSKRALFWGENNCNITLDNKRTFDSFFELGLNDVEEVSIGRNHMIVKGENKLFGYGNNYFGQIGKKSGADIKIIDFDGDDVDDIECGLSSSIITVGQKVYYLGAIL